jgi:hypothetical protein
MWLLLLFLLQGSATPCEPVQQNPSGPPALIVQVVDPLWIPIGASKVTVRPRQQKDGGESRYTDATGYARFWLQGDAEYSIEAANGALKTKRMKRFYLSKPSQSSPTAYVQLRLESPGTTTVY